MKQILKHLILFTLLAAMLLNLAACKTSSSLSAEDTQTAETIETPASPHHCRNTCLTAGQEAETQANGSPPVEAVRLSLWSEQDLTSLQPVLQNPSYPNGCEIASLATVLGWYGFDVTMEELDDTFLPKQGFSYSKHGVRMGADPSAAYVGEPSSVEGGWYCFEQPLARAADAYLSAQGSTLSAQIISGASLDELDTWLADHVPVIVWFTLGYNTPVRSTTFSWRLEDGRSYRPYTNLHCLVLTGSSNGYYQLADPLRGITFVSRETFKTVYTQMGQRAMVLTETKGMSLA